MLTVSKGSEDYLAARVSLGALEGWPLTIPLCWKPQSRYGCIGASYDEVMAVGDIRREDVLGAIALLDGLIAGPRLLDELHFG